MTFIIGWRRIPDNVPMNMRRVITKAIHRSSKAGPGD
ncbi:OLD family ATP-dependent endonuclease [Klebsiella pneumoniae]|uniref:OLD family ATP-dependent endonuclease n=1 Tax=Klebsiella pneumoniae TaxID=573 RepID=A0A2X3GQ40_KLEPN|nr:OLD family ATP-dependent endonuclease [Klebsiella pneumoniae]